MNFLKNQRDILSRLVLLAFLAVFSTILPSAHAEGPLAAYPQAGKLFPQADRFGDFEGTPPAAPAYQGDTLLGYVLRTDDIVRIPAYSGKPINMLVGLGTQGNIAGAFVLEHHEPILLAGIPESTLHQFATQYAGKSVRDRVKVGAGRHEGYVNVDAITGATVTVMVINETVMRAARNVAVARGILKDTHSADLPARVRQDVYQAAGWEPLTGNGAIRRMLVTRGTVDEAFKGTEAEGVDTAPADERDEPFIDMYYAYLNAPTIGRNLLGESQYTWLMGEIKPGDHAIAVMANGVFSFRGSGYVRGGIFDRVQIVQDNQAITFRDSDYYRLSDVYAEDMPDFSEMAIFIIRADSQLDPGRPWRIELLVPRRTGPLTSVFTSFAGDYQIPDAYVERPTPPPAAEGGAAPAEEAVWVMIWRERGFQIGVLIAALSFLTLILFFQDWLVDRPRLLLYLRHGYLLFTLFFIGWYTLAQLSVVNVLTFVSAVMHDFHWETFLVDPLIFILWTFVAVSLLLWGRGVYCGWLCPFGALQELLNKLARRFKVPQLDLPWVVHERLWALKYVILLVLFGISLQSIAQAEHYAEVEPFKTAITLRFQREWGYVLYAGVLLLIGFFNRKFYCKYLCPLGAALAIPARQRLFDWLRRRKECGRPCQICANECEVQAITPAGAINPNECHYCLDCQVTHFDERKCPPLIEKRRRQEKAEIARKSLEKVEGYFPKTRGTETDQESR